MKKKLISIVLLVLIILSTFNTAFAFVFFYDTYGHWAEDSIMWGSSLGLFNGYEDGTFRPDDNISRGEYMAILNRVAKKQGFISQDKVEGSLDYNSEDSLNYSDLDENFWGYEDIKDIVSYIDERKKEINIYDIFLGDKFEPNKDITREEAVLLTYFFISPAIEDKSIKFSDIDDNYLYKTQIYELTNNGIIEGYSDSTFRPKDEIKRAEAATIIRRLYDNMEYSKTIYLSGVHLLEIIDANPYPYFGEYSTLESSENNLLYKRAIETIEYKAIVGTIPYEERHLYDTNPIETLMKLKEQGYWNTIGLNYYLIINDKDDEFDKNELVKEMLNSYINDASISDYETMLIFSEAINLRADGELLLEGLNKWYNEASDNIYKYNALFNISKLYVHGGQLEEALEFYNIDIQEVEHEIQSFFYLNKAYILLLDNRIDEAEETLREGWDIVKTNEEYQQNRTKVDSQFIGALKEILIQKEIYANN